MKLIRPAKHFVVLLGLASILMTAASCMDGTPASSAPVTAGPLFDILRIEETSLHSGNLYYESFLSSDGTSIYYQSADGKSLMKSDYNGENPVILSNRFPSYINIVDGMVYFIEGAASGKVYKIDTAGQGETLVVDSNVKSLIVTTHYMFFIDTKDGYPYYCFHDGSKKTLLVDKAASQILLVKDKLYIQTAAPSKGIYAFPVGNLAEVTDAPTAAIDSSLSSAASSLAVSSSVAADSGLSDSGSESVLPTVTPQVPRTDVDFLELTDSENGFKSVNIAENIIYYIADNESSHIMAIKDRNSYTFMKRTVLSPFIVSDDYLYYINKDDESRLYRISVDDPSVSEMVVNDRVFQFVVCGNSIYYHRENKLELFRTPIDGGTSEKVT